MKYKYYKHLNNLNKKEVNIFNHFRVVNYDKKTQILTLRRSEIQNLEDVECNIFEFLDQLTRFHCLYIENPEAIDRDIIRKYVVNRMIVLKKTVKEEWVYVEKYDYSTRIVDNIYTLIIDYREPIVNTHKYSTKIGSLYDIYINCGMDKSKTLDVVMRRIERKISKYEEIRFLSSVELKQLRSILDYELENLERQMK